MTAFEQATRIKVNEEINRIPPEYLETALKILRVFREGVELPSAVGEQWKQSRREEFFDRLESNQKRAGLDFDEAQLLVAEAVAAVRSEQRLSVTNENGH